MAAMQTETPLVRSIPDTGVRLGGCSRTGVYRLLEQGELDSIKIGGRRMITEASIVAFIERQLAAEAS